MMILFFFESTWAGIKYSIVYDIFSTAGFIFDILYKLIGGGSQFAYSITPDELSKVLYTVAGIFMLFRATIGLIQMLINPDQTNDKQAGAGKLIMRIVVSIVLLILFTPGNYLIGKDGLLSRTEDAIVGNNGFLIKVFDELGWTPKDEDLSSSTKIKKSDLLVENVDAASNWTKTCYYYPGRYCGQTFKEDGKTNQCRKNDNFLKVEFSNTKKDGSVPLTCSGKTCKDYNNKTENISKIYVRFIKSTETITVKDKTYQQAFKKLKLNKMDFDGPVKDANISHIQNCNNWRISNGNNSMDPNANWKIKHVKFTGVSNGGSYTFGYNDWFGTNSLNELYKVVKYSKDILAPGVNSGGPDDGLDGQLDNEEKNKFERDASKVFVSRAMGSFENCVSADEEKDSNCEQLKAQQFEKLNTQTAKDLTDAMVDGSLELDFMMGTIGGVLCIVFLSLLCVDVIVRQLKLWILQILAPIPIVCYVDPKDKVFMQWLKTFAAVYVDLFIKLFALEVAIYLLSSDNFDLLQHNVSGIGNFFLIIAILVFAKGLPGMISKIFGIDGMGSFKEIGGMLKAGAGFGAGAIIGGAAGLATGAAAFGATKGQGFGNRLLAAGQGITSGASGMLRGAATGRKGDLIGGAKQIGKSNLDRKAKYNSGLTAANLFEASTWGRLGLSHAQQVDKSIEPLQQESERLNDVNKIKSEISSIASGSDFGTYIDAMERNGKIDSAQAKKWKEGWTQAQIDFDNGNYVNFNAFQKQVKTDSVIGGYTGSIKEDGKIAQIRQQMTDINNMVQGDATISGVVGTQPITSYADVKNADKKANKRKEEIFNEISRQTQTSEYRASKAANGGGSGNNNNN